MSDYEILIVVFTMMALVSVPLIVMMPDVLKIWLNWLSDLPWYYWINSLLFHSSYQRKELPLCLYIWPMLPLHLRSLHDRVHNIIYS